MKATTTLPSIERLHELFICDPEAEQARLQASRDKRDAAAQRKRDREQAETEAKIARFMDDQPGKLAWLIEREAALRDRLAVEPSYELDDLHGSIGELRRMLALKMAHFFEKLERLERRTGDARLSP